MSAASAAASPAVAAVAAVPPHSEAASILARPLGERQAHMEGLVLRVVRELTGEGGEITPSTPLTRVPMLMTHDAGSGYLGKGLVNRCAPSPARFAPSAPASSARPASTAQPAQPANLQLPL